MSISLKTLIEKLNHTTHVAVTRAVGICAGLEQYEVDIEHLFLALLQQERSDFVLITRKCGIGVEALERDLHTQIARFSTGSASTPVFSRHLPLLLEHAWLIASLSPPQPDLIRSSHLLLALLTEPELSQLAARGSTLFGRFPLDELKHHMDKFVHDSQEQLPSLPAEAAQTDGAPGGNDVDQLNPKLPALDQYAACVGTVLERSAPPHAVETARKAVERIGYEIAALEREAAEGLHTQRLRELRIAREALQREHGRLSERWEREMALHAAIAILRDSFPPVGGGVSMAALQQELASLRDGVPMAPQQVDADSLTDIVSGLPGTPLGRRGRRRQD